MLSPNDEQGLNIALTVSFTAIYYLIIMLTELYKTYM